MIAKLRKVLPLLLAVIMVVSNTTVAQAAATKKYSADLYTKKILVNGTSITAKMYEIDYKATIYVKVRDIANAVKKTTKKFSVVYDTKKNTLTVKPGKAYTAVGGENKKGTTSSTKAYYSSTAFYKNSTKQTAKVYIIDKEPYVALSSLAKIADFSLTSTSKSFVINTKLGYGETETTTPTPTPTGDTTGILQSPFPKAALITSPKTVEDCKNLLAYLILNDKMEYTFDSTISYDDAMKDGGLYDMFSEAQESYNSDHTPELFWGAVHDFHIFIDGNGIGSKITITFLGYDGQKGDTLTKLNNDYFAKTQAAVQNLIDTGKITKSMTQAQKAKAIYKWIAFNVTYKDVDGTRLDQTGYSAIVKGSSICTGFTSLYNLMCRYVGITEVEGVVGESTLLGVGHQWTAQVLDGVKVMTDATYVAYEFDGTYYETYFGQSAKYFKADYTWDATEYSKWNNAPGL